jgi:choline dehydrogenase-like flavoprotein
MSRSHAIEPPTFDYVIVGAGTAGCLVANRLSADPATRVLLLEAGGSDNYHWVHIPVGYLYCFGNPRVDWCFDTVAEPGLNSRKLLYPRGKVLGGCSSINGMIYMRGQAADYDHWRQLGNVGWSWSDMLPMFLAHEDQWAMEPAEAGESHERGGEWRIERPRVRWDILDAWALAAEQAGIPRVEDFNRGDNLGSAYFHVNQKSGWRWNTAKAFLHPVRSRPNLTVWTGAEVDRLRLDGRRVTGADVMRDGADPIEVRATREVVLTAGAVGSPVILQRSGIGPGAVVSGHGVPVVHDLPGVGENLQDHLQVRLAYKVHGVATLNERSQSLLDKARIGLEYALYRSGPMSMAPSQLGTFARSDPSRATPNLQYHIQPLTLPKFGEPLDPFPAFTASVCNLRPESRGHIRLAGRDRKAKPEIRPNYLSAEADRRVAAQSIRLTRHIVGQPALARFRPEEFRPGSEVDGDEALAKAAGDIGTTIFHPVGTCKMGRDPMAVVDPRLKVVGLEGLRVVDASIMPTITSGNTNAPTLAIAEKGAAIIREEQR